MRRSEEFWTLGPDDDADCISQRMAVMRFYRAILFSVAESLCIDQHAASASLESFAMWLRPDPTLSDHQAVARSCMRAIANAKKGSIERRLVRATLCGTFQLRDLTSMADEVPGGAIGSTTYTKSRQDFNVLLQEGELPKKTWSRQRYDTSTLDDAIRFILAYENVAYLSWGTKKIKLDGATHDAPSILLKKPATVIYNQYKDHHGQNTISRPSFFRVCSILTNGTVEPRTCIDYVTGFLIYDTFDVIGSILEQAVPVQTPAFKAKLDVIQAWLKYGHASQVGIVESIGCPRHDVKFGLSAPTSPLEERAVSCAQCTSLHRFFQNLIRVIEGSQADASAIGVIHDIVHKIELFMGHRLRVVNQQRAIAKMIEEAKDECRHNGCTDLAVILIDFKMKAEPIYFREKTADHYGKRGMSWHGVQIRSWETSDDADGDVIETILYYDQLSSSDNKQDKGAVVSLLEATMMALRRHLPHIKRVVVQSDNASCYQNACVIVLLPIIGYVNGITVERYEHTETQDGKSPLDGHFGQAQRKVRRFVTQGNNCVTPTQYVVALVADGGLPNCVAELVEYDRGHVADLLRQLAPMETALSKLMGRANDIYYDFPSHQFSPTGPFEITHCPDFTMRVFSYFAVGSGKCIRVSPASKTCLPIEINTAPSIELENQEQAFEVDDDADADASDCDVFPVDAGGDDSDPDDDDPDEIANGLVQESSQVLVAATGVVTGVGISKTARLVRRARKWRHAPSALDALRSQRDDMPREASTDKDMASFAMRRLLSLHGSSEIGIVDASDLPDQMTRILGEIPDGPGDVDLPLLKCGWARRPPNGKMYGAKYIRLYGEDVRGMYERGANDKGEKLGAGRMVEELRRRYPGRFDLPSEGEVRAEVSRLFNASRKRQGRLENDEAPPAKRRTIPVEYAEYLQEIVASEPKIMPAAALLLFKSSSQIAKTASQTVKFVPKCRLSSKN